MKNRRHTRRFLSLAMHALLRAVFALLRTPYRRNPKGSHECERGTQQCVRHGRLQRNRHRKKRFAGESQILVRQCGADASVCQPGVRSRFLHSEARARLRIIDSKETRGTLINLRISALRSSRCVAFGMRAAARSKAPEDAWYMPAMAR